MIMQELGGGQGFLKAGFLGFPKSGKTYTAVQLALGVRSMFKLSGRIAFFDTETGVDYVSHTIKEATGSPPVGLRSRSLGQLLEVAHEAEDMRCSVMIVDSVTHVWRELCDSFLLQLNQRLDAAKKRRQNRLEFQDWNPIKAKWGEWTDWYLNSKMHVIICGRAGFEYEDYYDENDRKQIMKTGTKMKTESEFGFEPSLLIEMDRIASVAESGGPQGRARKGRPAARTSPVIMQRATVIGDRFAKLTGAQCDNPTWEFFKPHLDMLTPGAHSPIDMASKTDMQIDDQGSDPWMREKRQRVILCEEIKADLLRRWPSETKEDKRAKADVISQIFNTGSWTRVENTDSSILRDGRQKLLANWPLQEDPKEAAEAEAAFNAIGGAVSGAADGAQS